MKYAALGIVLIGALVCYGAKPLLRRKQNQEPEDKSVLMIKSAGLGIAFVGVVLLILSDRM